MSECQSCDLSLLWTPSRSAASSNSVAPHWTPSGSARCASKCIYVPPSPAVHPARQRNAWWTPLSPEEHYEHLQKANLLRWSLEVMPNVFVQPQQLEIWWDMQMSRETCWFWRFSVILWNLQMWIILNLIIGSYWLATSDPPRVLEGSSKLQGPFPFHATHTRALFSPDDAGQILAATRPLFVTKSHPWGNVSSELLNLSWSHSKRSMKWLGSTKYSEAKHSYIVWRLRQSQSFRQACIDLF